VNSVNKGLNVKKYLLLIEDEKLWEKFKETLKSDINSEIMRLIRSKIKRGGKDDQF
jgi:hypothetical protein